MALTESGQTNISTDSGALPVAVPINDNIGLVCYDDLAVGVTLSGRVLDVSSGSLIVGAANPLSDNDDRRMGDVFSHTDDAAILAYEDAAAGPGPSLRVLTRSGTTITENTEYPVESADLDPGGMRVACSNSTVGLVAYNTLAGAHRLCRFTITGTTLIVGTPQTHTQAPTAYPLGLGVLDTNRLLYLYVVGGAPYFQVINISTGISEGTHLQLSGVALLEGSINSRKPLAKLAADKFIAIYAVDAATDRIEAVIINTSGDSIASFGTPFPVVAAAGVADPAVYAISSTQAIIIYRGASNATRVQTLNISGSTITDGGDAISLTQTHASYTSIPILISGKAVAAYANSNDGEAYVSLISGVPVAAQARFYSSSIAGGPLVERFTLPFSGVAPQGMTLDKSLGTVVIGSDEPAAQPVIYSTYPYVTGTATSQGFPTDSSVSALKWI